MTAPYCAGEPIAAFASIRRRMVLDHCKWDPQVGDAATLAPFPLVMSGDAWRELAALAEALAAEVRHAAIELGVRPDLHHALGLPRWLRRVLRGRFADERPRAMRFDFHWTGDGWRISEVNADVPGGYAEGSALPALVAPHVPGTRVAGDPMAAWVDAIADAADGSPVAFVSAPGFMEDHQVVAGLARALRDRHPSIAAHVLGPAQLDWRGDRAFVGDAPLGAIVRFCQVEWLRAVAPRTWRRFFETTTPVLNDVGAALVESKRFPLVWDALRSTRMSPWRRLLPETRDPRRVPWRRDERWLLKTAFCNTGDSVALREDAARWRHASRAARWFPNGWIAQQRFEAVPLATPIGAVFPCVGVFAIDGRAAGAYVRLSRGPIVDWRAVDVALLVEDGTLRASVVDPAAQRPAC